jgi:hypothetical protein
MFDVAFKYYLAWFASIGDFSSNYFWIYFKVLQVEAETTRDTELRVKQIACLWQRSGPMMAGWLAGQSTTTER